MRVILTLLIIWWITVCLLLSDISEWLKWVVVWWIIGFVWVYFQAKSSNYIDLRKQWEELMQLFWNYQTICDDEESLSDDVDFKKELLEISLHNEKASDKMVKEDEDNYYRLSDELSKLRDKRQFMREKIYAKAFVYFPKTKELFTEYTNMETNYYLDVSDLEEKPALWRYNYLKDQEIKINDSLSSEINSHNIF